MEFTHTKTLGVGDKADYREAEGSVGGLCRYLGVDGDGNYLYGSQNLLRQLKGTSFSTCEFYLHKSDFQILSG